MLKYAAGKVNLKKLAQIDKQAKPSHHDEDVQMNTDQVMMMSDE